MGKMIEIPRPKTYSRESERPHFDGIAFTGRDLWLMQKEDEYDWEIVSSSQNERNHNSEI